MERIELLGLCLALAALCGVARGQEAPQVGDVIYSADLDTPATREGWSQAPGAQWIEAEGRGTCLRFAVPVELAGAMNGIQRTIDLTPYRGCRLAFECLAKAAGVTPPVNPWNGVKFMLHYRSEALGDQWTNQNDVVGTFDWKKLSFAVVVAADATVGELFLGLQDCSGTAWFDDLRVQVYKLPAPSRPGPMANPGPVFRGHNLPRLRGVMSPNEFRDEDLRVLGQEWKANVIRWQMTRYWGQVGTDRDLEEYDRWLGGKLDELDRVLEACGRYGIRVVMDMHSPPGGRLEGSEVTIFHEPEYQDHWVKLWEMIARRYKGNPVIWGYDLINEPVQHRPSPPGVADYLEGQVRVARAIRAIDPDMPIFIEANEWDSAAGFQELMPVDVPNVVYQVHMYTPGEFTHQGVYDKTRVFTYPGLISGAQWHKYTMRRSLQGVRDFQLAYNAHIYVGEFSAARWASGAAEYLSDCIELFEEYGWDWTYHAYREWDGWSVEHGPDPSDHQPTAEPTDRMQVLLSWFARNEKP